VASSSARPLGQQHVGCRRTGQHEEEQNLEGVVIGAGQRQRLQDDGQRHRGGARQIRGAGDVVQRQPHVPRAGVAAVPHLCNKKISQFMSRKS